MFNYYFSSMRVAFLAIAFLIASSAVCAYCGDGVCNTVAGESRSSCCEDCACGSGMVCLESGDCDFAQEEVQITGRAITHLYGFDGWFAALVAAMAVGVLVLYKLRT